MLLISRRFANAASIAMPLILALFCFCDQGKIRVFDVDSATTSGSIPLVEIPITREGEKITITKVDWMVS